MNLKSAFRIISMNECIHLENCDEKAPNLPNLKCTCLLQKISVLHVIIVISTNGLVAIEIVDQEAAW